MGRATVGPKGYGAGLKEGRDSDVWITFDDGHLDNFTAAFPALVESKMVATFFVIVDRVLGGAEGYMTLPMLREMLAAGMSIESHTLSHPRLARIPIAEAREELRASKLRLEDALGAPVTAFCYPYGNHSPEVVDEVRSAGYELATSTIRGNRNAPEDRFLLKRVMVMPGKSAWWLRYAMSPAYEWLHARKNRRRWKDAS